MRRVLAACVLAAGLAACGPAAASGPGSSGGHGVEAVLRSCAPAGATVPPCDGRELRHLRAVLRARRGDVVHVHGCWGNAPRNFEDIEARHVVLGPLGMPIATALRIARSDPDVSSVASVPLPFRSPACSVP